jgi:hypothetical protein
MKRFVILPLLLVFAAARAGLGNEPALEGHYLLRGRIDQGERYRGEARIQRRGKGLELVLRRGDVSLRGPLRPAGSSYYFSTESKQGIVSSLPLTGKPGKTVLEARYRRRGSTWFGQWRMRRGSTVVSSGTEQLRVAKRRLGAVRIAISVDWEGRELSEANLAAVERFRQRFPEVPLTHFLNAAYFTKPGARDAEVAARIKRALRSQDELGLHLHGWRSLIEAAGVEFEQAPSFWGANKPLRPVGGDEGHEVEIAAYSAAELEKILTFSKETLRERGGLQIGGSFRAGGWVAPPHVMEAIAAAGFGVDTSAVPPKWHEELSGLALRGRIQQLWGSVHPTTQPYRVRTPKGVVVEMPDTCALADYVTAAEMTSHVREALARQRMHPEREVYVHLGFHLETAARYLPRLEQALLTLRADADPRLALETLEESAARVRADLEAEAQAEVVQAEKIRTKGGLPPPSFEEPAPKKTKKAKKPAAKP